MPGWAWALVAGWAVVSVVVGLLVGRTVRQRDQQVPADNSGEEKT